MGTPSRANGDMELKYVRRVCEQIGAGLRHHHGAPVVAIRSSCGDIKYLWEFNRHLPIVTLAQAYALSDDARAVFPRRPAPPRDSIMDAGGNVPMTGDSDDALVVQLAQDEGHCKYRSLLATGAMLFRRGDFKTKADARCTLWRPSDNGYTTAASTCLIEHCIGIPDQTWIKPV